MTGGAPIRALIVDDTSDLRVLLRQAMSARTDVEVVAEAVNGQEAIDLAAALQPELIVLDLLMPVLSGMAALPELRRVAPASRVVVLSTLPASSHREDALKAGAAAYVDKSTSIKVLVDELLSAGRVLDSALNTLSRDAHWSMSQNTAELATGRRFVADTLRGWEQSALSDTVALLMSELLANAVLHANASPDVTVRLLSDRVHVEVADSDSGVGDVRPLASSVAATSGRGLALVEALAMAWGSVIVAPGKVVWFDVARD